ncbi:MAG: hypothetical protein JF588_02005 [Caulobacterales bacterium]|nr:hypothetical protein [Caulobacterales bacterium]
MSESIEEIGLEESFAPPAPKPDGELVHWMARGPVRLGTAGVAVTAAAAFALGVAAALGALAAYRYLEPRRDALPPWRWRRGQLH